MDSQNSQANIAILWDIENVTPPSGSGYIQSIIDTISERGMSMNIMHEQVFSAMHRI